MLEVKNLKKSFGDNLVLNGIDIKMIEFDSRRVKDDSVFVALIRDNIDGHEYINSAYENGARVFVIEKDVEKAVASKMAIEYIGGMTDNTILAVLIDKNLISRQELIEGYGRAVPGTQKEDSGVKKLQSIFSKNEAMIYPDDKEDHEISL
jgi:UDP-N-acetylmuramyl pentapeptide synthase